jgi:multiple sugar transport system substrate-binding protein
MKRILSSILLALFLVVSFQVGCVRRDDKIQLRCIGWGGVEEAKIVQQAVVEFKKAHPGVEVKLERTVFTEYITKILTQFSAQMAPDVMCVNAEQMPAFATRGVFLDLKPFVDKDPSIRLKDFYPEAIGHYTYQGMLTALPRDIAPIAVLYYNKDIFKEAGLPVPQDNWTVEKFLETAKKLTKVDDKGKIVRYGFTDDWPIWDVWVYAFGGRLADNERHPNRCTLDSPEAATGAQFRADLIHKHKVMPSPSSLSAMGGLGNSDLFMNGAVGMYFNGIWMTPRFREIKNFEWDVVLFPRGPGKQRAIPLSAAGYSIVKGTKHPELAYELVKCLAGETGQKFMTATGLTQPALKTLAKSPVFLDGLSPKSKGFLVDAVKYGHFQPTDPNVAEWYQMVGSALDRVWTGDETAASALAKVTKTINTKFYKK